MTRPSRRSRRWQGAAQTFGHIATEGLEHRIMLSAAGSFEQSRTPSAHELTPLGDIFVADLSSSDVAYGSSHIPSIAALGATSTTHTFDPINHPSGAVLSDTIDNGILVSVADGPANGFQVQQQSVYAAPASLSDDTLVFSPTQLFDQGWNKDSTGYLRFQLPAASKRVVLDVVGINSGSNTPIQYWTLIDGTWSSDTRVLVPGSTEQLIIEQPGDSITSVVLTGAASYSRLQVRRVSAETSTSPLPEVVVRQSGFTTFMLEGAMDDLQVALRSQPEGPVTIHFNSSTQWTYSSPELTFDGSNWDVPQV
ncbi:MAG: hypothetical protein KDA69_12190, partial [Planctomycetaceae bacterium]|nr:hypothetical protein [Planctomycetaceae bacterium]